MSDIPRGRPPADAVEIEGEVPFHDVDPLHIVWHGHYYKYFEVARTKLFRRHRVDGPDIMPLGYRFVVVDAQSRYIHALRYGERYRVRAWFVESASRIGVAYEIESLSEGHRAARGLTRLVTTDPEGKLLFETPEVVRERIDGPLPTSEAR